LIGRKRKLTASLIREISLDQMSEYDSKKYLKKIKTEKFGKPNFKEFDNLISFL